MANVRIYVADLAKYNEGILHGEWFDLPMDLDELNEAVQEMLGSNEECAIHDYEAPFKIDEYDSLADVNEKAQRLEDSNIDDDVLEIILENADSVDDAFNILENGEFRVWNNCKDMEDVAAEYMEETGMLDNVPDSIARYFDYEAFGRDMEIEGTFWIDWSNAIVVEITR